MLNQVEPKLLKKIIEFLSTKDLSSLGRTSSQFNQICKYQLSKTLLNKFEHFHRTLLEVYQFRKKEITQLSKGLYKIPKTMPIKVKDLGMKVIKISLNDLPYQFRSLQWQLTNINQIFEEDNKLKNQVNAAFKCGKYILIMNRTLVDPTLNVIIKDSFGNETKEMLQKIAESDEFDQNFTDMQSILVRQRQILEKLDQSKLKAQAKQKEEQEPNIKQLDMNKMYALILCHGGYFAIGIYEKNVCIYHKSDHKYVVRKKAGQRQLNKDSCSGSNIKSMGSQIRRDQEKKHQMKINNILTEAYPELEKCDLILLQAPGVNYQILIQNEEPLFKLKHKIRSICLTAKKANHTEIERVNKAINDVYLMEEQDQFYF